MASLLLAVLLAMITAAPASALRPGPDQVPSVEGGIGIRATATARSAVRGASVEVAAGPSEAPGIELPAAGEQLRPLKLGFYGTAATRSPAMAEFLEHKLLPAAAALLGRSVRVRLHACICPFRCSGMCYHTLAMI